MQTLVVVLHVVVAVAIVGLVLLQQGKGADAGASFGAGASQTVFGSSGSGSFLVQATTVAAVLFYVTSLALAIFARGQSQLADPTGLPIENRDLLQQSVIEQQTAADDLNEIELPVDDSLPQIDAGGDIIISEPIQVTPADDTGNADLIQIVPAADDLPQVDEPNQDDLPNPQ